MTTPLTVVVTVSSIIDRDRLIKRIYTNLTADKSTTFTIQQDQVNRIKIFHNVAPDIRVLIRTYIVIVLPVLLDLSPVHSIFGEIDFHLDETISHLQSLTKKLQALQGRRTVKGSSNFSKTLENLLGDM